MNILDDTLDTYRRLFELKPEEAVVNITKAMEDNPKLIKQISHAIAIPLDVGTVAGMAIGMSSDEHKVGNTILGAGIGTIPGAAVGLAMAGKIAKNAKII